ncbi:striatin family protein [Hirsutella rhossiliensis]|uniref:Striatin family domain-containing protein n=1 Tax=Hirsutella rhossiliensis TaxID=111463 RepID=A0A9P8N828_9HYPO|nr:striatin family domain-containing protein [Hirsutella rhossiliensis]KAH0966342.1 striatin family domain-containing protein [Hirsutella rhossiliensis]
MGPNAASGMGGMDMGMGMGVHGNGTNQPQATEYTLQGVMRFLQTEWHRHERDRNAWEIERQEMRGRIASLEGQARRADATQKALKKYVSILERKVKDQAAHLKGAPTPDGAKDDRAARIHERLQMSSDKPGKPADDDAQRNELKSFLDQCQAEFTYLMVTPANPQPPRDSPPLPMMEDLRDVEAFGMPGPQHMDRQYQHQRAAPTHAADIKSINARQHQASNAGPPMQPPPSAFSQAPPDFHSQPMVRSAGEPQPPVYASSNDWSGPVAVTTRAVDEGMPGPNHAAESLAGVEQTAEMRDRPPAGPEPDGWEFPEGAFADHGPSQQHPLASAPNRPDTDVFPNAEYLPKSPNSRVPSGHRRKSSMSRRRSGEHELAMSANQRVEGGHFKLRFGLRGHLDTVRTVIFSGGGSPGEPEICTAGDDGMIKRFHIPRLDSHAGSLGNAASDLDVIANFTHRGHSGSVLSLTSWSPSPSFSTGGRAQGDGWIFSGGQDATIQVWERGRVDPKATLEGHTDAVWALCVLPTTLGAVFGSSSPYGSTDRILLVSGAADGTVRLWSVSAPPQMSSPQPGTNRNMTGRGGRVRGNSMSSGSGFSNSPQPTIASSSPFHHTLVHVISRADGSKASPTCITSLGGLGESYVVAYSDAAVVVYDTRSGEPVGQMDSMETYDGSMKTSVNAVVATTSGLDQGGQHHGNSSMGGEDEASGGGPTGGRSMAGSGVEGTIISGHEDRFVRFFDANSGQCTYNMLAHPDAISSLSLSPDGRELLSAGHDASLRFWSLEKRSCTQEITSHRVMRGEGVCSCVWSQDGKWVVSGGGDGLVKVFAR